VEQGAGLSVGQETQVSTLLLEKEAMAAERDAQVEQIGELRAKMSEHLAAIRERETERSHVSHATSETKMVRRGS